MTKGCAALLAAAYGAACSASISWPARCAPQHLPRPASCLLTALPTDPVCRPPAFPPAPASRRRGGITPEDLASLRQPTWCRLLPQHFSLLLGRAAGGEPNPETLLLVHHGTAEGGSSSEGPSSGSSSSDDAGGGAAGGRDEFGVPETVAQALAEAALMVADPAATHTAAAVSDLSAGPGGGSNTSETLATGQAGADSAASASAAGTATEGASAGTGEVTRLSSGVQEHHHQPQQQPGKEAQA